MDISVLRGKLISTLTPWRGEGGIVVLSSVEQLSPVALEWLLGTLTGVPDEVDQAWTATLATRTIFFLASDEIGRSSLIRHKREGASSVPTSTLLLDLRHDWREFGARWEQGATILPFFAIDREQVKLYALLQLRTLLSEWTTLQLIDNHNKVEKLSPPSGVDIVLLLDPNVLDALTGSGNVEYVCE
jgi:hypothetical protein